MTKSFNLIFGGIIAFTLLLIYSIIVIWILWAVLHAYQNDEHIPLLSNGLVYVVTTIGGLVSALVVAKLAITKPGDNPAVLKLAMDESGKQKDVVSFLIIVYLSVWFIVGLSSLIIGVVVLPDSNQTLSDIGTTWLGLAIASGYAYFGIQP
ncbi:MAG: hypothetical protein WBB31_13290 [Saprospiraceae bacterium]